MKPEFVLVGRRLHMILDEALHVTVCGISYDWTAYHTFTPRKEDTCNACKRYMNDDFWGPITSYREDDASCQC